MISFYTATRMLTTHQVLSFPQASILSSTASLVKHSSRKRGYKNVAIKTYGHVFMATFLWPQKKMFFMATFAIELLCSRRTTRSYPCSEHWASSKLSCFENLQSQIQICLYMTSEILCVGGKLTRSDRTNSRKASRGGSVSTHRRKSVLHFVV